LISRVASAGVGGARRGRFARRDPSAVHFVFRTQLLLLGIVLLFPDQSPQIRLRPQPEPVAHLPASENPVCQSGLFRCRHTRSFCPDWLLDRGSERGNVTPLQWLRDFDSPSGSYSAGLLSAASCLNRQPSDRPDKVTTLVRHYSQPGGIPVPITIPGPGRPVVWTFRTSGDAAEWPQVIKGGR